MKKILPFLFVFSGFSVLAQTVTIKKVELAGDKIFIYYDLENSNASANFLLNLYGSKDNFAAPLVKVGGDIGDEVKPGLNRKIEWRIREEYGNYKGNLALEIRGRVYVPFVKLQTFAVAGAYKRGKNHDLIWQPGNSDPINIELFKGSDRMQGSMSQPNNGAYVLSIPSTTKTGSDYRLKITSTKSSDDVIYTPYFKIKPKVPILLKFGVPLLVVGGAAAALGGGGGSKDNGTSTSASIVLPPFPGN